MSEESGKAVSASGDPYAVALKVSPYNIVQATPNDGPAALLKAMQTLQGRGLTRREDLAFRTLRNLAARLSWDLLTLGTTPSVTEDEWSALRSQLSDDRRREAAEFWLQQESHSGSLHIRAVLALNDIAWQTNESGQADDETLISFVAWWAALLFRKEWLKTFATRRCQSWELPPPDSGDEAELHNSVGKLIGQLLISAAGPDPLRLAKWTGAMDRERAAIEAVDQACSGRGKPPAWPAGFGPLGLRLLHHEDAAREWTLVHARTNGELLPLLALKSGQAGFFQIRSERINAAARAVQFLFSELGAIATLIWQGNAAKALTLLSDLDLSATPAGLWFGSGGSGRRRRGESLQILKVEALLLQFQDDLARPEVSPESVGETAARILSSSAMLPQPGVGIVQVESRICGRLTWCADADQFPDPREVERILNISREVQSLLVGRGEGKQCGLELAKLLNSQAVTMWKRVKKLQNPARLRHLEMILRDLFEAAELAPHNTEVVSNLAGTAIQFPSASQAEERSLLMKVLPIVRNCITIGKATPQLEDAYDRILEVLDPEEARKVTVDRLRKAIERGPQTRS